MSKSGTKEGHFVAKKIENPLITGLSSKIYFLAYVNPETGYKIAKKIYGTPKTEKIYKWGKTLRKSGYLEKTKLFTANVKPLVIQIKYQLQQQGIQYSKKEESELESKLVKLLESDEFKRYVEGFCKQFQDKNTIN